MNQTTTHPVPFVVGCGRSGTTLLRSMLDSHPDLAIPGENEFVLAEFKAKTEFSRGGRLAADTIRERLEHHPKVAGSLLGHSPRGASELTLPEWLTSTYRGYANEFGKGRYGDKTPALVRFISPISRLLPEAVFIHLIRDGRDVVSGLLAQEWGPSSVRSAARMWRNHVVAGRAAGLDLPHHRYLELRYENLVRDPEASLRDVCAFISIDYDDRMLDFRASAQRAQELSRFPESHARLNGPTRPGVRDWQQDMGPIRRVVAEAEMGRVLECCGYEPSWIDGARRRFTGAIRRVWRR